MKTHVGGAGFRISKKFDFDAAHWLPKVPDGHKCKRMHGHTYQVEIICESRKLDDRGMIVDYSEIAEAWAPIHSILDHHVLNEIEGLENPTTEILVNWIYERLLLTHLKAVRVYESSTTYCETWGEELF